MKAREIIFDFINEIFSLGLVIFVFIYIVLGDRLGVVYDIISSAIPAIFFLLFYLVGNIERKDKEEKIRKESDIFEVIRYLTRNDKIKDWIVLASLPILMGLCTIIDKSFSRMDVAQMMIMFSVMVFFHKGVFRKFANDGVAFLTHADRIIDRNVIYLLPLLVLVLPLSQGVISLVDDLQAFLSFVVLRVWHKFFFSLNNNNE